MNKEQIDLLIKNNYEVLPEIGFIRENTFDRPLVYITYDAINNYFSLGIVGTQFTNSGELNLFQADLASKLMLASELNALKD